MKRAFALVLAVTLFFSFSVVGFAAVGTDQYYPKSYYYYNSNNNSTGWFLVTDGAGKNGSPVYADITTAGNISWTELQVAMERPTGITNWVDGTGKSYVWFVFDWQFKTGDNVNTGEVVSALRARSALNYESSTNWYSESIVKQYISHTDDGHWVAQVLCSFSNVARKGYCLNFDVDSLVTYASTNSRIQTNAIYYCIADSANDVAPPLDPDNPYPSEPDGPMSPPTESDQWVSEQYSGAVNPDLAPKIEEAYSAAETVDSFEQDMWSELDNYSADVNPDNFQFDPDFISSMGWIATTWTDCFNGLGSWQSVITFPMFLGLAMLIIGRGSQAIDRGVAKVQRRQMRDEYRRNRREEDA